MRAGNVTAVATATNIVYQSLRIGIGCFLVLLPASCGGSRGHDPLPEFPSVVLWAWDRPEHMAYIDPHEVGVAFLAETISWREDKVAWKPRYQPLEVPPGTEVMAVVRLESFGLPLPDAEAIAGRIIGTATQPRIHAVQVDFDARQSEREWYASLLGILHRRLPKGVSLNITALASWCLGDAWIKGLPINDAVPMLFRMGEGEPHGVTEFSTPICRSSVGISTDEAPLSIPHDRRIFIFHPHPWTPDSYHAAIELARRLR